MAVFQMMTPQYKRSSSNPRILVVTPEITYLPSGMGNMANTLRAKAGGLADVSASLVAALFDLGADVHVALPHYRRLFHVDIGRFISNELRIYKSSLPQSRVHLAQDRIFYYRNEVYSGYAEESQRIALAFQREVINNIVPLVDPDLIHCNDWMTGLVPPMARRLGIPCLFTVHNIHTHKLMLAEVEEHGIDAAEFWKYVYFERHPHNYEETRATNPVDFLATGIFAAHFVNTVSPTFLDEICDGQHPFVPYAIRSELAAKRQAACAFGILNAPDHSFDPQIDEYIAKQYDADTHVAGKLDNKRHLAERLGWHDNLDAPLFFWPSRLDPIQKGCQLLAHVLYDVVSKYWDDELHILFVANGPHQQVFRDIVRQHSFEDRIAVCDFDEELSRLGYAASDFVLMPSAFEPCGLPQMIATIYGSIPIVHDTGGLHDTVEPLDASGRHGNGIRFNVFDSGGLKWAVDEAMSFYRQPPPFKHAQVARIMREGREKFNHNVTAQRYFELYEKMLERPLVNPH